MKKINLVPVSKNIFTAEFNRRLFRLYVCLEHYFEDGCEGNLLTLLFQAASYCWCYSPRKSSGK